MKKLLIILSLIYLNNSLAQCPTSTIVGINNLVEENPIGSGIYLPICNVNDPIERKRILDTQIDPQEEIRSSSLNLKYEAINKALDSINSSSSGFPWIALGSTSDLTINSPSEIVLSSTSVTALADKALVGDGFIEVKFSVVSSIPTGPDFPFGFSDVKPTTDGSGFTGGFKWGFYIERRITPSYIYTVENGSLGPINTDFIPEITNETRFKLERLGSNLNLYVNGNLLKTISSTTDDLYFSVAPLTFNEGDITFTILDTNW